MAKDRIERDELASKLIETASGAEDPLRAMAELLTDFVMEAEVTAKVGAEPHERSDTRVTHRKDTMRPCLNKHVANARLRAECRRLGRSGRSRAGLRIGMLREGEVAVQGAGHTEVTALVRQCSWVLRLQAQRLAEVSARDAELKRRIILRLVVVRLLDLLPPRGDLQRRGSAGDLVLESLQLDQGSGEPRPGCGEYIVIPGRQSGNSIFARHIRGCLAERIQLPRSAADHRLIDCDDRAAHRFGITVFDHAGDRSAASGFKDNVPGVLIVADDDGDRECREAGLGLERLGALNAKTLPRALQLE